MGFHFGVQRKIKAAYLYSPMLIRAKVLVTPLLDGYMPTMQAVGDGTSYQERTSIE